MGYDKLPFHAWCIIQLLFKVTTSPHHISNCTLQLQYSSYNPFPCPSFSWSELQRCKSDSARNYVILHIFNKTLNPAKCSHNELFSWLSSDSRNQNMWHHCSLWQYLPLWCHIVPYLCKKRICLLTNTTAANLQRTSLIQDDSTAALSHNKASSAAMSGDSCTAQVTDKRYSL